MDHKESDCKPKSSSGLSLASRLLGNALRGSALTHNMYGASLEEPWRNKRTKTKNRKKRNK
jgi:hypothetical protein